MFFTQQLNVIPHLLMGQQWSDTVQKKLDQEYLNLEATLLRAKVLRKLSKPTLVYLLQTHINPQSVDLSYLFSPFILSNLNKKAIYATPKTETVLTILNKYYQADKKMNINVDNVLNALNLHVDLLDNTENNQDFLYINLIKALCRTDISSLFLIGNYNLDQDKLNALADFLNVKIYLIPTLDQQKIIDAHAINLRKLLFKNKDDEYRKLCSVFSQKNAKLLSKIETLNDVQANHLIEDMFYTEHIYEKISVYAEYIQTQIQHFNV